MVTWHPLHEWRRAHSRRMENLTSSPPRVKNEEFSEKVSPQSSCFSPGVTSFTASVSPFSEKATKGCHTFLHGEAIMLAPLFSHSPFSILREPILQPPRRCDNPYYNQELTSMDEK